MSVRAYVIVLTLAGLGGSSALALFGWWALTNLQTATEELRIETEKSGEASESYALVRDFLSGSRDVIDAMDLYPDDFNGTFVIARETLSKAKHLLRDLQESELSRAESLGGLEGDLDELGETMRAYQEIRQSEHSNRRATRDGRKKFDEAADVLGHNLFVFEQEVGALRQERRNELEHRKLELDEQETDTRRLLIGATCLYFVVTMLLAWRTYLSLARPISRLADAAEKTMEGGTPFALAAVGPQEVKSLTTRLGDLVHGLEETVARRTQDLREKAAQLEREMNQRKELETQLVHAQKLEAVGQLAAGIAHEINSPSQFVNDNVLFLRGAVKDLLAVVTGEGEPPDAKELEFLKDHAPESVEQALQGMDRITTIVKSMKNFAHRDASSEKKPNNLNQAIQATTVVASNEWKYYAELELDLDLYLPLVPCNVGEINQVVLNLIVNAAHAIRDAKSEGEKGLITVSTKQYGEEVVITIRDDGGGIPEEVQAKVFEPFFTTKEVGVGTGQGLAIAHNVVTKSHGGLIWFEVDSGVGTTFFIRLPLGGEGAG